jgi:hypothetical protein
MNKRNALLFAIILVNLSCSTGNDDMNNEPIPDPISKITYTNTIKAIMMNNCTDCHGNPTSNGAPMSLTTYQEVKNAVNSRGLINRINSTTNPMPPTGIMSINNRTLIQQWKDDGLLE